MQLQATNSILALIRARSAQARLRAFKHLLRHDGVTAATYLTEKVSKQRYAKSEDFQFLNLICDTNLRNTYALFSAVLSGTPSLRHHLQIELQEAFWKIELASSDIWTDDKGPGKPRLNETLFQENGLTLEELKIPLSLLLTQEFTPISRLAIAHLLVAFRHEEIKDLLKGTPFEPVKTSTKSLIYSKRFDASGSLVKSRAHKELFKDFLNHPPYRACADAERLIFDSPSPLYLVDKYILYSVYHQFGVCLQAFTNEKGQIFVPGIFYGTNSVNDYRITRKGIRTGFTWMPIRAWNPFNWGSKPIEDLAERHLSK